MLLLLACSCVQRVLHLLAGLLYHGQRDGRILLGDVFKYQPPVLPPDPEMDIAVLQHCACPGAARVEASVGTPEPFYAPAGCRAAVACQALIQDS